MGWFSTNYALLLNGVAMGLLLFMMAVGLTVIFGMLDILNLAHGAFFMVGAYLGYRIAGEATATWGSFALALVTCIAVGAVIGVAFMLMTRPLVARGHMDQALLTLGLALVVSQLLLVVFGKDDHAVAAPGRLSQSVSLFGSAYPAYRLAVIVLGLVVAAGVWLILEKTSAGAIVRATVSDRPMVEACGIDVRTVMTATFAGASALAVVAGLLAGPIQGASSGIGDNTLLLALVVIVIGGLGSVAGTLLGAMIIGLMQSVGVMVAPELASFLTFGAMVLVLAFRPQGLIPARVPVSR